MSKGPRACYMEMCNRIPEKKEVVWPQEHRKAFPSGVFIHATLHLTPSPPGRIPMEINKMPLVQCTTSQLELLPLGISKSFQSPPFEVCITWNSYSSCRIMPFPMILTTLQLPSMNKHVLFLTISPKLKKKNILKNSKSKIYF